VRRGVTGPAWWPRERAFGRRWSGTRKWRRLHNPPRPRVCCSNESSTRPAPTRRAKNHRAPISIVRRASRESSLLQHAAAQADRFGSGPRVPPWWWAPAVCRIGNGKSSVGERPELLERERVVSLLFRKDTGFGALRLPWSARRRSRDPRSRPADQSHPYPVVLARAYRGVERTSVKLGCPHAKGECIMHAPWLHRLP
jgi:hypothetical protein